MAERTTREGLLDCGLQLFLKHGYNANGIKAIVDAAGVPKGSFYYFFPGGKEAFVLEVLSLYLTRAADHRAHFFRVDSPDPLLELRRYFEALTSDFTQKGFLEGCLLGNLSAEVADHSEPLRLLVQEGLARWEDDVAEVLTRARELNQLSSSLDIPRLARFMVQSWEGALIKMKAARAVQPLHDFLFLVFDGLLVMGASNRSENP